MDGVDKHIQKASTVCRDLDPIQKVAKFLLVKKVRQVNAFVVLYLSNRCSTSTMLTIFFKIHEHVCSAKIMINSITL